jgi:hypothetical protein
MNSLLTGGHVIVKTLELFSSQRLNNAVMISLYIMSIFVKPPEWKNASLM